MVEVTQQCLQLKTYYVTNYPESSVKVGEAVVRRLGRGVVSKIIWLKLNREEDELKNSHKTLLWDFFILFFLPRCTNRKYLLSAENLNWDTSVFVCVSSPKFFHDFTGKFKIFPQEKNPSSSSPSSPSPISGAVGINPTRNTARKILTAQVFLHFG